MAWNQPGGNGKDPWGNKPDGEQGPPDLDEIFRKIKQQILDLVSSGGMNDGDGNNDHISLKTVWFIFALIFIVWLQLGWYTIQPAYQGVVLRFGAHVDTTNQGLNWHIPYPIERVEKVNVEELRAVPHEALMLTQDENIVSINLVVQYQINDAGEYLFNVRDPDNTLHQATESALREVVGSSKMDMVLTSGRDAVAAETKRLTQEILNRYKTGLSVRSVNMQNVQPPEQVQAAFADVIKAREDEERSKNKAEAYRNEVLQQAGGTSDRLVQEAHAYKSQVVALAKGESSRFTQVLAAYQAAPEITRKRLYLETMESVFSKSGKMMIDIKKSNPLLMLPTPNNTMSYNGLVGQTANTAPIMIQAKPRTAESDPRHTGRPNRGERYSR